MEDSELKIRPIGIVHSPFPDRVSTPRQPYVAQDIAGTIELYSGNNYEDALADLGDWSHIWVLFWFHLNEGWKPKVLPPRSSEKKRGVFATRSPHRPNPIGISVMKLERVEGLIVHVKGVDLIDGTPVLDIKPYVPFADAIPDASAGWIATDPEPPHDVVWEAEAREQATWLQREHKVDLFHPVERVLALGPQPHAYRRIREEDGVLRLAVNDWRIRFRTEDRRAIVERIRSGYKPSELFGKTDPKLDIHRAFATRFGV
ncbi:MAG: tRNA (N6-threonylcarbamoyladenosine(37)-N6)-methyltransferase TrmO [Sandaracinaceae bacterium]|nr:tRNA (N6-threonylcarbamoyladenosine(37)-N6)-methyltransferase TrmO [Sandaracinaceae bacterium]